MKMTEGMSFNLDNWFNRLKNRIFLSRLSLILALMFLFSSILLVRLFVLQIVRGQDYQNNYDLRIRKERTIDATRGNIYDRNGKLLAYNALSYSVTIEDSGTYTATDTQSETQVKNASINKVLANVIQAIEANGDSIDNDFGIYLDGSGKYQFSDAEGTARQRFRADIFGHSSVDDLKYNSRLGFNEADATPNQIMNYLMGDRRFQVSKKYAKDLAYKITVIRYEMSLNSYQKYIPTIIASGVSDETVAYVKENADSLTGVDVSETSTRKYDDAEAFSSVLGYVGTISSDEYAALSKKDKDVTLQDKVGKAGIEQYMNSYLTGKKGSETVYVDNVGTPLLTTDHVDPVSGNDVYLSIDKDLQDRTYHLLEQELAGILCARLANVKEVGNIGTASSEDEVAVYDAYIALVNNHLIDASKLKAEDATDVEKSVEAAFEKHQSAAIDQISNYLKSDSAPAYNALPEEYQKYATYIVKKLKSDGIFDASAIDSGDQTQAQWTSETLSVNDYLKYALEQSWIDVSKIESTSKYLDTDEAYNTLVKYITDNLADDSGFHEIVWRYAVLNDEISGGQLCAILYDQGVLQADDATRNGLASGSVSAFAFMQSKIQDLEITPGQLGLDPCSASSVVLDSKTGEVLACVSYPGYDSNKLSDASDSSYYAYLNMNSSRPLYNYATQQRTAPGSTFKPMTATAGLSEGVLNTTETITDEGIFTKVSNHPKCWIYPRTHGTINLSEAIRDSCNYFFYEVGYRLASEGGSYNDATGINLIQKYASEYGLDKKTGLEIEENTSQIATEYPVMAAIGQSDNNITTAALARYATAISNGGTVFNMTLLDHVANKKGKVLKSYAPSVENQITSMDQTDWDAIHTGMRMVVENLSTFDGFSVPMAGKTGTAQSSANRASHALFIGYAPYDDPQITVATRIGYGYSSHYAAEVSKNIVGAYFGDASTMELLNSGTATSVNTATTND